MKIFKSLLIAGAFVVAGSAFSNVVDQALVKQCIADVDREGNSEAVVSKYCGCMVEQQEEGDNTELLKWANTPGTGATADAKCEKDSGWK